jgi:hypothetical protein
MPQTATSEKTDQVLVGAYLRSRDEASFRELYRRHTPALYALALRLCDTEPEGQAAIQNMWIRACSVDLPLGHIDKSCGLLLD